MRLFLTVHTRNLFDPANPPIPFLFNNCRVPCIRTSTSCAALWQW
jgi:hypothetical protein